MHTHLRTFVAIAAVTLCATTAVACASSPQPVTPDPNITEDPLAEFSRYPSYDVDQVRAEDSVVAACMKDAGFEYTPMDLSSPTSEDSGVIFADAAPTKEWVEEHGYGIVEGLLAEMSGAESVSDDPDTEYLNSLSPAQRTAYDATLWGEAVDSHDPASLSWEKRGCSGKAEHTAAAAAKTPAPPILQEAADHRSELLSDGKFTLIFDDWRSCMADAGHPDEPFGGQSGAVNQEILDYFTEHPSAKASDEKVIALKKAEVAVALADRQCQDDTDLAQRVLRTLTELEKGFMEEHKSELDEARIWVKETYPDWSK